MVPKTVIQRFVWHHICNEQSCFFKTTFSTTFRRLKNPVFEILKQSLIFQDGISCFALVFQDGIFSHFSLETLCHLKVGHSQLQVPPHSVAIRVFWIPLRFPLRILLELS